MLRRDGQPITLPPKDLETLLVLVERTGHIVEKEELLARVWPGVFIEEGNLSRHIFNLRQVLGDSPDGTQIHRDYSQARLSLRGGSAGRGRAGHACSSRPTAFWAAPGWGAARP